MSKRTNFNEERHEYTIEGQVVPSVTQILTETIFVNMYKGVRSEVMKRASNFGNDVHEAIELDDVSEYSEEVANKYFNYLTLIDDSGIIITDKEKKVFYFNEDDELFEFAGTFDLEAKKGSDLLIGEVKTTYQLNIDYISWQLSLYNFIQGMKFDKGFVIWLPRRMNKGELVEIDLKSKEQVIALLKMYKERMKEMVKITFEVSDWDSDFDITYYPNTVIMSRLKYDKLSEDELYEMLALDASENAEVDAPDFVEVNALEIRILEVEEV